MGIAEARKLRRRAARATRSSAFAFSERRRRALRQLAEFIVHRDR
jgi:hypothetical protein